MISDAKKKADAKFKRDAYTQYNFRFHNVKDNDIIVQLETQENRRDYLRKLIRSDIEKNQ